MCVRGGVALDVVCKYTVFSKGSGGGENHFMLNLMNYKMINMYFTINKLFTC